MLNTLLLLEEGLEVRPTAAAEVLVAF